MRWGMVLVCVGVVIGATGCGGGNDGAPGPEDAVLGNCAPLADVVFSHYQERIDTFADRELNDLSPNDFSSRREEVTSEERELDERAKDLQCNPKDLLLIVAERGDELEADSPAASVAKAQFLSGAANAFFWGPK